MRSRKRHRAAVNVGYAQAVGRTEREYAQRIKRQRQMQAEHDRLAEASEATILAPLSAPSTAAALNARDRPATRPGRDTLRGYERQQLDRNMLRGDAVYSGPDYWIHGDIYRLHDVLRRAGVAVVARPDRVVQRVLGEFPGDTLIGGDEEPLHDDNHPMYQGQENDRFVRTFNRPDWQAHLNAMGDAAADFYVEQVEHPRLPVQPTLPRDDLVPATGQPSGDGQLR